MLLFYWMKTWVEVERGVGRKEDKSLPATKLYEKVEGAVVVRVGHDSSPSNPQIDLLRTIIKTIPM